MAQENNPKITFLEIGSVTCIPCKKMQPILKSIEQKYGDQIKIIFYDVKKSENQKYVQQYKIKLIPTQVFLDEITMRFTGTLDIIPKKKLTNFFNRKV